MTYAYDVAGRHAGFGGELGGGPPRDYSLSVSYDDLGGIKREQFGTQTPLYNKRFYNSRGQLAEIRLGAYSTDEGRWSRGAILNVYSAQAAWTASGADNGNLRKQMIFVPHGEVPLRDGHTQMTQFYGYDSLNRLASVEEKRGETDFFQTYDYDRWGNRTVNAADTWLGQPTAPPSELINEKQFAVNPAMPNKPGVPAGQTGQMVYDDAGSLIFDSYSGQGGRAFDAEGRMAWAGFVSGQPQTAHYTYDADGRRVKRKIGAGSEVWQVYGAGGELLAEYAADSAPSSPQKEYGYRAGELLVTAESGPRVNVALAANGATAAASSTHSASYPASSAINGDRTGAGWGTSAGGWNDGTGNSYPDWLEVTFGGAETIDEVSVFTIQDNFASPTEPTRSQTFTQYGITAFEVQYWTGSQWVTVPGGSVSGNNKVWRKVTFPAVLTSKIRVHVTGASDGYSRITELEAWGPTGAGGGGSSLNWLVTDHLGTPRMVVDETGALAGVKRHDYLPFGEEVGAGVGGRTAAQGYSRVDHVRQRFTGYERDDETGLDYAQARYYGSTMGRFTSVDPVGLTAARLYDPQQINLYAYCRNNPLAFVDPTGEIISFANKDARKKFEEYEKFLQENRNNNGFAALIATVQQLKNSDVTYNIALGGSATFSGGTEGNVTSDGEVVNVTIGNVGGPSGERFSLNSRFGHELEHARQFDSGEFAFAFDAKTNKPVGSVAGDISSEVKAWQAQLIASAATDFQVMGGSRIPEFQFRVLDEFGKAKTDDERAGVLARISDGYKSSLESTRQRGAYGQNFSLPKVPPGTLIRPADKVLNQGTVRVFGRTHKP